MKILNEKQKEQYLKKLKLFYNEYAYFNFVNGLVLFADYFNESRIKYITSIFNDKKESEDIFYYKIFIDNGDVFIIIQCDRKILFENKNEFLKWYKEILINKNFNDLIKK